MNEWNNDVAQILAIREKKKSAIIGWNSFNNGAFLNVILWE